ncbi:hypothetical protein ACIPX0_26435 [Streptomyces sp. NPDC090075]|uniref:hypothetical protein n=1 Tax=Streptomyces sp. NPDC090075 TaxID=3365937 RepID=UPI0037F88B2A
MEMLAGQWWQNVDVWAIIVSSVVALLVGWLGAWATLRSGKPKRNAVGWWVHSNTSLITRSRFAREHGPLTVHLGAERLERPRIIELEIANLGDQDITAATFHDGAPLRFSFGSPVLMILEYGATPAADLFRVIGTYADPPGTPAVSAGSGIEIGPTLLRRGQRILVTVLVDGEHRPTLCTNFPLVDVEEVQERPAVPGDPHFVAGSGFRHALISRMRSIPIIGPLLP